jgi:hypothetical protein
MPKMNIVRRQKIDADPAKVYQIIADMSSWQKWSPWLIMEQDAKVDVNADVTQYKWTGKRVGEGEMQITDQQPGEWIDYDLSFYKPWKSKAKIRMKVNPVEGGTDVEWHMDSKLPWFMWWMRKPMEAYLGNDYERGLLLLNDYAKDGEVHSHLREQGRVQLPATKWVGISRSMPLAEAPAQMGKDFQALMPYAHQDNDLRPHEAFCVYHKWDMVKGKASWTAAVPCDTVPVDLPAGWKVGERPACIVETVEHTGPYQHIGNAWAMMANRARNKEFKTVKGLHPFETYGNSPMDTAPNDLISRIHFPVK